MLYTPHDERLWDTWLVHHDDLFYLFYLRIAGDGGWDGISLATSRDLVHFERVGAMIEKLPSSTWLGTGSVMWADGRWVMNFSEDQPGTPPKQVIRFAESKRLEGPWRRIECEDFAPDPAFYEHADMAVAEPTPRWDSIGTLHLPERGERPWLGFFTANARHARRGSSGTVGMAESADGVHWHALPPPLEPGLFANCEVVEHCRFEDRHYLLFTSNTAAGVRFDRRTPGNSGGTFYVVGDRAEGPFVEPPGDPLLQGTRRDDNIFAMVVGRPFCHPDGSMLFSHHWARHHRPPNGSWGPVKRLIEVRPWELGLAWWEGNEGLKGRLLADGADDDTITAMEPVGQESVCDWSFEGDDLIARDVGGCAAVDWRVAQSPQAGSSGLSSGRIFETGIRVTRGTALGFWVGTQPRPGVIAGPAPGMGPRSSDHRVVILLDYDRQMVIFTRLMRSLGPSLVIEETLGAVEWPLARGVTHRLRVLVRGDCIEAYVDDRYAHGVLVGEGFDTSRVGFAGDRCDGRLSHPRLWAMQ